MKMAKPEMTVVRFNENDIIVASGDTLSLSKFGDGQAKNGVVNYKNQAFTLTDSSAVNAVLAVLNADGYPGSTLVDNGSYNTSVKSLFNIEANVSGDNERGVRNSNYSGNYLFVDGRFRKQ